MKLIESQAVQLCADMMHGVHHGLEDMLEKCDSFKNHKDSNKIADCASTNSKLSTWLGTIGSFPTVDQLKTKLASLLEQAGWTLYEPTDLVSVPKQFDGYFQDQIIKVNGELVTAIYQRQIDKSTHDVMTWGDYCIMSDEYNRTVYIKPATRYIDGSWNGYTTEFYWWDRLEILPPCRHHNVAGFEVFHISERITANIVSWYARCHTTGDVIQFQNYDNITDDQILEILSNVEQ